MRLAVKKSNSASNAHSGTASKFLTSARPGALAALGVACFLEAARSKFRAPNKVKQSSSEQGDARNSGSLLPARTTTTVQTGKPERVQEGRYGRQQVRLRQHGGRTLSKSH